MESEEQRVENLLKELELAGKIKRATSNSRTIPRADVHVEPGTAAMVLSADRGD